MSSPALCSQGRAQCQTRHRPKDDVEIENLRWQETSEKDGVAHDSEGKNKEELLTLQGNLTPNLAAVTAEFIDHPGRSYPKVLSLEL